MTLDVGEMKGVSGNDRFVRYERPVYKPGTYLRNGTRDLTPVAMEKSDIRFKSFNYMERTTNRYQYCFKGTICFLKNHFLLKNYKPIRTLIETLKRLVNSE